ncbi:D-alanyl-D-alanine carboxypeptidase [Microbacterium esteraromaticum]|uniref:D-alanyl-D-alanine carboxypeptidase n=1 Tax=Microbacterium esteraromaticum TaxID=57043 RepID=A0A7D7W7V9_9MICO|nr:D-alanyl-D-alanine carboxypeptidase [Microbacterium esteraromaticum]QMU96478.1 D-alanyl-D-alanine carboxypeptidase [Microbacterium esteraromaticum]
MREPAQHGAPADAVERAAETPPDASAGDTTSLGAPSVGTPADGMPADGVSADGTPADGIPADGAPADTAPLADAPAEWADASRPPTALTWLEPSSLLDEHPSAAQPRPLFDGARLTPGWRRPRVLIPLGIVTALCGAYVSTTLLWPLNAVAPTAQASPVTVAPAPAAAVAWPAKGSAAIGIQGMAPVASGTTPAEIASISKVVSVMMVLDELPLNVGEQGPSFEFTAADQRDYWTYRRSNQSSLDVPVGGSLTEYQMLQGIMLGSANNYIDRLADELWGSQAGFAEASAKWLSDRGIEDVTLVSPSGFSDENVASPAALIQIAELAMANPVFAEIVATRTAEIPGVGVVTNTNKMLDDPGVVGVKTGTLKSWNLLTAKDVTVGDTTVRLFASVLGQDSNAERLAATRELLAGVEKALTDQPTAITAGTVVGHVSTEWGDRVDLVTDEDARLLLWNGAEATTSISFSLGDSTKAGAEVGTLTAKGPLDTAETSVSLADEITQPTAWWRLTHPLELFGFDND